MLISRKIKFLVDLYIYILIYLIYYENAFNQKKVPLFEIIIFQKLNLFINKIYII